MDAWRKRKWFIFAKAAWNEYDPDCIPLFVSPFACSFRWEGGKERERNAQQHFYLRGQKESRLIDRWRLSIIKALETRPLLSRAFIFRLYPSSCCFQRFRVQVVIGKPTLLWSVNWCTQFLYIYICIFPFLMFSIVHEKDENPEGQIKWTWSSKPFKSKTIRSSIMYNIAILT